MLIEQITEFQLRAPEPSARTCTTTTGCFHEKTKIFTKHLQVDYFIIFC